MRAVFVITSDRGSINPLVTVIKAHDRMVKKKTHHVHHLGSRTFFGTKVSSQGATNTVGDAPDFLSFHSIINIIIRKKRLLQIIQLEETEHWTIFFYPITASGS